MSGTVFVWPYYHNAARSDELRWSMRSVAEFYTGECSLVVVGDKAPWYAGNIIEARRKGSGRHFLSNLNDALHKFYLSLNEVQEENVVWMMDDVFFMKSFSLDDLRVPRADSLIGSRRSKGGFSMAKIQTKLRLEKEGLPTWNFATHLPHVVNRELCLDLFDYYDIVKQLYLWEIIYENATLERKPEKTSPFFSYLSFKLSDASVNHLSQQCTVVTSQDRIWCEPLRRWLYENLKKRPSFESSDPAPPKGLRS